jgi:hypothetical protein
MEHVMESIIAHTKTKAPIYKITFIAPVISYDPDDEIDEIRCEIKTIIYDYETYKQNVYEENEEDLLDHWSILTGKCALASGRLRQIDADWLFKNDYKKGCEVYVNLLKVELIN